MTFIDRARCIETTAKTIIECYMEFFGTDEKEHAVADMKNAAALLAEIIGEMEEALATGTVEGGLEPPSD